MDTSAYTCCLPESSGLKKLRSEVMLTAKVEYTAHSNEPAIIRQAPTKASQPRRGEIDIFLVVGSATRAFANAFKRKPATLGQPRSPDRL